jgi:hypothetical protein
MGHADGRDALGARGMPRRRALRPARPPLPLGVRQRPKVGDDARASSWGPGDAVHGTRLPATRLSYGPPWAHYLGGYQDRLLGGPLGLPGLRYTASEGVEHKDYSGVVLG